MNRRSWIRAAALFALGAIAGGCLAPTLPIPPPGQPEISGPDASGLVTLKGAADSAQPNAEVAAYNPVTREGRFTVASPNGSWELTIPATSKQTLWLWQTVGFERSSQIEVHIP